MAICLTAQNPKYMKLTHEITILLKKAWDILNKCPRWRSANPCLNLHITRKDTSLGFNVLGFPGPTPSCGSFTSYSGPTSLGTERQYQMFSQIIQLLNRSVRIKGNFLLV